MSFAMAIEPTSTRPRLQRPVPLSGGPLRVVPGGRNRAALITVQLAEWEELRMELQALRAEAIELVDLTLPAARHLELLAHEHGPTAWNLAATLVDALANYRRRFA